MGPSRRPEQGTPQFRQRWRVMPELRSTLFRPTSYQLYKILSTILMTDQQLQLKSIEYRQKLLRYITAAGAGHTGGSLSCVDILNVLYNRVMNVSPKNFHQPDRDRYIQSKGHSVEALYVVLADLGFFPESELETMCQYDSPFVGHPTRKVPGIEMNTGALGHGLPISVGLAIAVTAGIAAPGGSWGGPPPGGGQNPHDRPPCTIFSKSAKKPHFSIY
mgnify:CR=1 FL=1